MPTDPAFVAERAAALLSKTYGTQIILENPHQLVGSRRSLVYRFGIQHFSPSIPKSVIIKQALADEQQLYNPDDVQGRAGAFLNECASLQFLQQLFGSDSPAPIAYAADQQTGLLAMEDLGASIQFDRLLLGHDRAVAEQALVALAQTLGIMHAGTSGQQSTFEQLRNTLGPRQPQTEADLYSWINDVFHTSTEALSVQPAAGVTQELTALIEHLRNPGPFLAFIHGDICPDNCMYANRRARLIDLEPGCFGSALCDGVFGRMFFPSCMCVGRIPESVLQQIEQVYRTALAQGCPAATDDRLFYYAFVAACAYWTLMLCQWVPIPMLLERDWIGDQRDTSTARQRMIARIATLAQVTEERGFLEGIGATMRQMEARLRSIWPAEADALGLFPAFR